MFLSIFVADTKIFSDYNFVAPLKNLLLTNLCNFAFKELVKTILNISLPDLMHWLRGATKNFSGQGRYLRIRQGQLNFLVVRAIWKDFLGQLVGKIIVILSFRAGTT